MIVIQARASSSRLPGKVFKPLLGKPMLSRQLERIHRVRLPHQIVVATSTEPEDDEICTIANEADVLVVRGSLTNVLSRFSEAIASTSGDPIVRLTADCPLTSPTMIDHVICEFKNVDCDYASNTLKPTFPDGLDVEVFTRQAFLRAERLATSEYEREHVTPAIYSRPELFRLKSVTGSVDLSCHRWTVDTAGDFEFVTWVYEMLYPTNPRFDTDEILDLLRKHPEKANLTQSRLQSTAPRTDNEYW